MHASSGVALLEANRRMLERRWQWESIGACGFLHKFLNIRLHLTEQQKYGRSTAERQPLLICAAGRSGSGPEAWEAAPDGTHHLPAESARAGDWFSFTSL